MQSLHPLLELSNEALLIIWITGYVLLVCGGIFYDSYILGKGGSLSESSAGEKMFSWGWTWPVAIPTLVIILVILPPFIGAAWAGEALGKRHKKS